MQVTNCSFTDSESGPGHFKDSLHVDWQLHHFLVFLCNGTEECPVLKEGFPLLVKVSLNFHITRDLVCLFQDLGAEAPLWIHEINTETISKLIIRASDDINTLVLNMSTVETIFSVDELNNIPQRVTNSAIILDHDFLQGFDQFTLDVTCFSSLHSGINKTLTTSHGVEEELCGRQATQIRVLDKPTGFWRVIILGKVRQCTVFETEWNTLSFDRLLSHDRSHLRNVNSRTLGPRTSHLDGMVEILQALLSLGTGFVTSVVKST